ncbi:hypothetical protein POM88_051321 [Heracleum sosnowskyi]|uniref:Uncharacterized protein n=1 Tax=Heracleum sosnowskyi TaxID=360622 RepID=A0AAD8M163_9APIA|nr:hypothetical protein POM88_051321 [Heracleum sosnowskyi]
MQPPSQHSMNNLAELRAEIVRKLGGDSKSKDRKDRLIKDDGREVSTVRFPHPPLGIPFCAASTGGASRSLPLASSSKVVSSFNIGGFLDKTPLRECMKQIAATQGLEGVPLDCAKTLNNGLDAYLKGLVRSSIALVGSRSGHELEDENNCKHQPLLNLINSVTPSHHFRMQSSSRPPKILHECRSRRPISMLDFKVAMELSLQQLGENWPLTAGENMHLRMGRRTP